MTLLRLNCAAVQPATGCGIALYFVPRVALRLHGVINIGCLPVSDRKHETFCARFARQGIHIHRINAKNVRQSPQEIHHVKPHTGF
jgi:hypothetical protein